MGATSKSGRDAARAYVILALFVRNRIALALIVLLAVAAGAWLLPLADWAEALIGWLREAGPSGVLVFAAAYIGAILLMLPGSPLAIGAGFVFGAFGGVLVASPASVLGSTAAFLIGRWVARDWAAARIASNPRLARLDGELAKRGFRTLFVCRLAPIMPFNFLNYALGATRLELRAFVLSTLLGTLPSTIIYAWLGSRASDVAGFMAQARKAGGTWGEVAFWLGAVAAVLAVATVARLVRRAIVAPGEPPAAQPEPPA
jgi:uncharacterized membrane protein YdjX (TVP38/TMEM64 family)